MVVILAEHINGRKWVDADESTGLTPVKFVLLVQFRSQVIQKKLLRAKAANTANGFNVMHFHQVRFAGMKDWDSFSSAVLV